MKNFLTLLTLILLLSSFATSQTEIWRLWRPSGTFDVAAQDGQAGSLVSVQVMKDWFWYIARGGLVTVELTVISIVFACLLALFGSLGRLSKMVVKLDGG